MYICMYICKVYYKKICVRYNMFIIIIIKRKNTLKKQKWCESFALIAWQELYWFISYVWITWHQDTFYLSIFNWSAIIGKCKRNVKRKKQNKNKRSEQATESMGKHIMIFILMDWWQIFKFPFVFQRNINKHTQRKWRPTYTSIDMVRNHHKRGLDEFR